MLNTELMMDYLSALAHNNDRVWYQEHKKERQEAEGEFLSLVSALMPPLSALEPTILDYAPKSLTFKQVRDTRFGNNKLPYNPSFRAHIGPQGKLPIPVGFYLMLQPGKSFLGGGLFTDMFQQATAKIRDHIAANPDEWEAIITRPGFSRRFTVEGISLKNVPKGYDPDHPQARWLKHKSWYLEYKVPDELILDADGFCERAVDVFTAMAPFNRFLNRALEGFEMPKRPG